jgi:integrase
VVSRAYVAGRWAYSATEAISWYRPRFHEEQWYQQVRALLEELVTAIRPPTPAAAYKSMVAVSYFVRFMREQDAPMDVERLFTPENVDWYVAVYLREHGEHSRSTQRGALEQIGRTATRRAKWKPDRPQFAKTAAAQPYTNTHLNEYFSLSTQQRTEARCRTFQGILVGALGSGLRGQELQALSAADIDREGQLVFIRIHGDRARRVPVRREYSYALLQLALEYPEGPLLGRFREHQKNPLSAMKSHLELHDDTPPLEFRRLRATWMVTVLNEDIQLATFAQIAGITDLRISHLLPYLTTRKDAGTIASIVAGYAS